MTRFFKGIALAGVVVLSGCATTKLPISPSTAEVYNHVHRAGAKDAVKLLKHGMENRQLLGQSDPVIPMRVADEVVPVFIVPHVDRRTGRYVEGHWEHAVVKESKWFITH